jgi:hypothetical protein
MGLPLSPQAMREAAAGLRPAACGKRRAERG